MMAAETIERAIREGFIESSKCKTKDIVIGLPADATKFPHLKVYGSSASDIEEIMNTDPAEADLLHLGLPYTRAEIRWICRNEMPVNLEDVLARRTRALFMDARASMDIAPAVAVIMAEEMGFDDDWKQLQINSYLNVASGYIL
jgi:glycerol-3-phosphate dehydrogenase